MESKKKSCPHELINYIDIKSKCHHLKKLTSKETLRQVFIRVYRLEIKLVMLVFRPSFVNCCPSNLLSGSTSPFPSFPVWISILYIRIQCVRGVCMGFKASDRLTPSQVNFFRWRHFALSSLSLIFSTIVLYLSSLHFGHLSCQLSNGHPSLFSAVLYTKCT